MSMALGRDSSIVENVKGAPSWRDPSQKLGIQFQLGWPNLRSYVSMMEPQDNDAAD